MKTEYLSAAETAKLIRIALKKAFPKQKFSVRSKTYSGGASINIGWTDGPTQRQVDNLAGQFHGAGFDGMIDLKYSVDHWLMPDGSVAAAHWPGTEGSMGTVPAIREWMPDPAAKLVHFGADYVFCNRHISDGMIKATQAAFARLSENERLEMLRKVPAGLMPASFRADPELADFGDKAPQAFYYMAHAIPA